MRENAVRAKIVVSDGSLLNGRRKNV